MAVEDVIRPVEDSVARIDDEVAVGEDLDFQRRWWRFENAVWIFFGVILALDLAGLFGRGPVAKTQRHTADGTIDVHYERIERTGTPSSMRVEFGPGAIHDGKVRLYVSESMVKELGTQRVVPAPLETAIGGGGLTYTFPATNQPASIEFSLQPTAPGHFGFLMQVPGAEALEAGVVVAP